MTFSIKSRIYMSFAVLVVLFVVNGIVSIVVLNKNKALANYVSQVINPSFDEMYNLRRMIIESKMFTTNWVFLRFNQDDKDALIKLHSEDYPQLKGKLNNFSRHWENSNYKDSLNKIYAGFESLFVIEQSIMNTLKRFGDYDEPMFKWEAERLVEDEVIPRTAILLSGLNNILNIQQKYRDEKAAELEASSFLLHNMIISLAITILLIGIFMSVYMTRKITAPIHRINKVIKDIAKGIINPIDVRNRKDEIGRMMIAVNCLSENLKAKALFAKEIGKRNFESRYFPASDDDALDHALLEMRDNLQSGDEQLNQRNAALTKTNAELDKFVYSVSHDLRAPLSSMLGVVEISEEETTEPLLLKNLGMLKGSIKRLDGFILDILHYSQNSREEIRREEINFKEMVDGITTHLNQLTANNRQVKIKVEIGHEKTFISDKTRINIVLNNIITNAVRYQNPSEIDPFVDIKIDMRDTETNIIVRDNGIGIDRKNIEKIFDMFYRVSETSIGSGLGLYIVKETMDKLQGKINVASEKGVGTTFQINIPNLLGP